MRPTDAQLVLLGLAVAVFVVGGAISFARLWFERASRAAAEPIAALGLRLDDESTSASPLQLASRVCLYCGLCLALSVLLWHILSARQFQAADNFDTLVALAVLLALFVMYVQRVKPIGGLDWFVMPVVILLLAAAGFFGRTEFREYQTIGSDALLWVHRVTAYSGAVAFAIAAAGGAMSIISRRRLRRKSAGGVQFASLERLDRIMMTSVTLGFAALTIGAATGFVRMFHDRSRLSHLKLAMAVFAWLIYAVAMHAPFNPRFRGRRAAMLSIFGFVLVIGVLIVVQYVPGKVP